MVPNSASGSDEEEEEVEEDVEQSVEAQSSTSFESTSTAAIFSGFTKMSRQLAEMMEIHRKQQLVAKKKSARGALSFDSPPLAKSQKLKTSFTPTRSAADIIGATHSDTGT